MIKKIFFTTFLLVLLYNIFLLFKPGIEVHQHQWQDNSIKAQKYVYSDSVFSNVIVGTSLSARLPNDSLKEFYNLSFSGQSLFDGLAIVSHFPDKMPKRVFVETNVYTKDETTDFTRSIFTPVLYYGRKYLSVLRDGKQPLALTAYVVMTKFTSLFKNSTPPKQSVKKPDGKLFTSLLEAGIKNYSAPPDSVKLLQSLNNLMTYVKTLERNNVEVIFFEMPVDQRLNNTILSVTARNLFQQTFPKSQYHYIEQPDCSDYGTTDGLHLNAESVSKYVTYFKNAIIQNHY